MCTASGESAGLIRDEIDVRIAGRAMNEVETDVALGIGVLEIVRNVHRREDFVGRTAADDLALTENVFLDSFLVAIRPQTVGKLLDLVVAPRIVGQTG